MNCSAVVVLSRVNAGPAFSLGPQNGSGPCSRHDGVGLNASFRDPPKKIQQAVVLSFMLMLSFWSDMKLKVKPMAEFFKGLGTVR